MFGHQEEKQRHGIYIYTGAHVFFVLATCKKSRYVFFKSLRQKRVLHSQQQKKKFLVDDRYINVSDDER